MDTGSSAGEIIGQTKTINSVSIRPCRPLRAATASDDFTVNFYSGTPYKFVKSLKEHSRFVQCVRYAPDGSQFATCGSDGKIFLYDGESGDLVKELKDVKVGPSAHASGILALCWSPDSACLYSSSMDQLTKCWNVASGTATFETKIVFNSKTPQDNQIVSNVWTRSGVLVLSLSGAYAVISSTDGEPKQTFDGHQRGISALVINEAQELISAGYDGSICKWDQKSVAVSLGKESQFKPTNQIDDLAISENGAILALTSLDSRGYSLNSSGQAEPLSWLTGKKMARVGSFVACLKDDRLCMLQGGNISSEVTGGFASTPTSLDSTDKFVAVGFEDKTIALFKATAGNLTLIAELSANLGAITSLAFNEDGTQLAAGDDQRRIKIYDLATHETLKTNWCYHSAKVSCLAWLRGHHAGLLVSGSLDNGLLVWSPESPIKPVTSIPNAHTCPIVSVVAFEDGRFASASQDGSIKVWQLSQ